MRAHGRIEDIPPAGPADHLCWVYDDDAAFDRAAREFLAGGLARGERLLCVGERVIEGLQAPGALPLDLSDLVAEGTVETLTLAEAYETGGPFVPEQQLAYYDAATRRARAAGYRGLRVIAEVSALAADPVRRDALIRWEHLADAFAASGSGFSAMCAYRADLAPEVLADVAAVHPMAHAAEDGPSFRLFVDGGRLVLEGSVDAFSSGRLARVLTSTEVHGDVVVLDVTALEFFDVGACRAIAHWAVGLADRAVTVEVAGASALLRRTWRVIELDRVAPVRFVDAPA